MKSVGQFEVVSECGGDGWRACIFKEIAARELLRQAQQASKEHNIAYPTR